MLAHPIPSPPISSTFNQFTCCWLCLKRCSKSILWVSHHPILTSVPPISSLPIQAQVDTTTNLVIPRAHTHTGVRDVEEGEGEGKRISVCHLLYPLNVSTVLSCTTRAHQGSALLPPTSSPPLSPTSPSLSAKHVLFRLTFATPSASFQ